MSQELQHKDMIPIPIKEFISGGSTPVDVYIRLSNDKYVLLAKEDSKIQAAQLQQYEEKKVDFAIQASIQLSIETTQQMSLIDKGISRIF